MKRYKQILIGVSFLLAIALFIWGYNFLKGKDIFNKQTVYIAKYHQVSGLEVSNPVLINGVRVGQVSKIYFAPDMSGDVIVEIMTHNKFPVPDNSVAKITSADLMGSKIIDLRLGDSPDIAQDGDTLASLAGQMKNGGNTLKMLRILNGLGPGEIPEVGYKLKIVTD